MKFILFFVVLYCLTVQVNSQTNLTIDGKISYRSSQNVYVKFSSTNGINPGDTLYIMQNNTLIPVLFVINTSSTSCVCSPLGNIDFPETMPVIAKSKEVSQNQDNNVAIKPEKVELSTDTTRMNISRPLPSVRQNVRGSFSAASYSYYSKPGSLNSNRYQYNFTLHAKNIGNSKLSVESNLSFRHEDNKWYLVKDNLYQALKIYDLSLSYEINKTTGVCLGRKINPKVSSMGAIDGLQFEKRVRNFSIGAIAGSRPDYMDYGFDFSLPQLGGYIAHDVKNSNGTMQNTLAFVEQMNTFRTDRRFVYYQHSNSLLKNLYLFSTVEVDLYKKLDDKIENTFSLSSAYTSISYRMFKRLSLTASYDNRKNIIYYESYKNFINQVLDVESRQGLSLQANYNTAKNITFGTRAGYRFKNNNAGESRNLYAYVSYYEIPGIKASATLAATYLESDYLTGRILNLNLNRDLMKGKLYTDLGYQYVIYGFYGNQLTLKQHIIDLSLSWNVVKNLSLSFNFEEILEQNSPGSRLNLQIKKRF
jgi:hypothetical protein